MRSLVRCLVVSTVLASPPAALGADVCLQAGVATIVLKAFALPGKGVCKDARGWLQLADVWWVDGMACGSSDGTHVTFSLLAQPPDLVETLLVTLDRATLSGTMRQCVLDSGSGGTCVSGIPVGKVACSPAKVPVP